MNEQPPKSPIPTDDEIERIFVDYANDKEPAPLHRALLRAYWLGKRDEYNHPWTPGPADGSGAHLAHAMRGVKIVADNVTQLPPVPGQMLPIERKP